jgi:hypothetical protein
MVELATFESSDQLDVSFRDFRANVYFALGERPVTAKDSGTAKAPGAGSPVTSIADTQFDCVMVALE